MNDAMTPEEEAFLNPEIASKPEPKATKKRVKTPSSKNVAKRENSLIVIRSSESLQHDFDIKTKLTVDIPSDLNRELLRASLERKLAKQVPYSQRDIVAEALSTWLKSNGFLK